MLAWEQQDDSKYIKLAMERFCGSRIRFHELSREQQTIVLQAAQTLKEKDGVLNAK